MTNFSVKVVIFVLVFGSAVSDYERNIKEFCSKKYFDTIVTKPVANRTIIELYRSVEENKDKYFLWTADLEDKNTGYYRLSGMSFD